MKKELFQVGDIVICLDIVSDKTRSSKGVIVRISDNVYVIDFDDDYKKMTRNIKHNNLRKLTKLERALK